MVRGLPSMARFAVLACSRQVFRHIVLAVVQIALGGVDVVSNTLSDFPIVTPKPCWRKEAYVEDAQSPPFASLCVFLSQGNELLCQPLRLLCFRICRRYTLMCKQTGD